MYMICPLFPLFPLLPLFPLFSLSTYSTWNPPCRVRIRPPLLPVAYKLTPFVPSVTHLFPFTQNPDPLGFPDLNIHSIRMTL